MNDFYEAKGQYDVYLLGLQEERPSRKLFLAVDAGIFESFFQKPLINKVVEDYRISLLVFDATTKRIVQWITRQIRTAP